MPWRSTQNPVPGALPRVRGACRRVSARQQAALPFQRQNPGHSESGQARSHPPQLPQPQDPVGLNASAGGRHTGRSARGAGAGRTMALAGALAWADLWICPKRETRPQAAGGGVTDSSSSSSRRAHRRRRQQGAYCGGLAAMKSEKAHRQRGCSSAQSLQVRFETSSDNKLRLSPPQRN